MASPDKLLQADKSASGLKQLRRLVLDHTRRTSPGILEYAIAQPKFTD